MIAGREEEIRGFQPQTYYGIRVQAEGITFAWHDKKNGSPRTFSGERAEKAGGGTERQLPQDPESGNKGETPGSPPSSTI